MRVTTSKSKNSESFYITKGYVNDKGTSTSSVIRKPGTLNDLLKEHAPTRDDVMAWAREETRLETHNIRKTGNIDPYRLLSMLTGGLILKNRLFLGEVIYSLSLSTMHCSWIKPVASSKPGISSVMTSTPCFLTWFTQGYGNLQANESSSKFSCISACASGILPCLRSRY